ncbi:N-acetyltransferase B complex non catalytic subunit-domain-containing protein [Cunninghamella echinulata]|nr:N-acetyltransferase B complex non catalytic subunit-domain-containing protein [Cunninghamella echinulata]
MVLDYLTEKKLRPLYDAIDEGQYKIGLQHANKLLKKSPNWGLVKALKAIILLRTGKEEEAKELCIEVKKGIPTDDTTLQTLTIAYKELGLNNQIVELYENIYNLQPKNEEFGVQWFMAMVRINDFKGQQQAAVKLQRVFKKDKYLFWAIMSLALQGQNGNTLSYTLAERMMAKAQEENRLTEVEHMRLYLLILMDQQKDEQALKLLDTPLGEKALRDPEVCQIKVELELKNQQWDQVKLSSEKSLKENSDDWINWLAYFDAHFGDNKMDQQLIRQFILSLQQLTLNSNDLKRGPFLAELELDYRLDQLEKLDEQIVLNHIVAYYERFGSKNCCFEDLQTYIQFLKSDKEKSISFIQTLQKSITCDNEKSKKIKNTYKQVTIYKIERFLDLLPRKDLEKGLTYVDDLWKKYQDVLPLGEGLEKTEYQYGDEYVVLAGQMLFDLYLEFKNNILLIQAATLLEMALEKSIYNFQIKLLLIRIYIELGVYSRTFAIYKTMDIKQIQFDTMLHYYTDRLISLGCFNDLESYFYESLSIYRSNDVETPDMQVQAYKFGTFSKIQEFNEFRSRLDTSLQKSITKAELVRINALNATFQAKYGVQHFQELDTSIYKLDDNYMKSLSDNRDFKVMMNCNPKGQLTAQELIKPAQSTNTTWLLMFSYIFNILSAACDTKGTKDIVGLVKALGVFLETEDSKNKVTTQEYWLATVIYQLGLAFTLMKESESQTKDIDLATNYLKKAISLLENNANQVISGDNFNFSWQTFHNISIVLEAVSYSSVLLEIIDRTIGLTSKEAKRKASEGNSGQLENAVMGAHNDLKKLLGQLQATCQKGKTTSTPQLQKKLSKEAIVFNSNLSAFESKSCQSALNNTVKQIVSSWNRSISYLSDEVDRRILKL